MCPKCLLVICDLNVPYTSPCPSCGNSELTKPDVLSSFIHKQEVARDTIIRTETERIRFESEEQERERRSVQFPSLEGTGHGYTTIPTQATGYASKVRGVDHYKQIFQAYKNAQARERVTAALVPQSQERKVLSLSKKGKATIHTTKVVKDKTSGSTASLSKKQQIKPEELDDTRQPYTDENDDGHKKGVQRIAGSETQQQQAFRWPTAPSGLLYQPSGTRLQDEEDDTMSVSTAR